MHKSSNTFRRRLPHYEKPGALQSITYRLSDSVPQTVASKLKDELSLIPETEKGNYQRHRFEQLLDAGYGCCILRQSTAAVTVIDAWKAFDGVRYDLICWVVMPNHVHVLIYPYADTQLSKLVQSWKSYTARQLKPMMFKRTDSNYQSQSVWMRDYFDRFIRNNEHLERVVKYIHWNPVKAGLVASPEEWPWSSAQGFRLPDWWGSRD